MALEQKIENGGLKENLFDLGLFSQKISTNRVNHFHIYIDDDVEYVMDGSTFNAATLTDHQYGTLLHEYIHYIQHIQTLYGVNRCRMFNRLYIEYINYLKSHDIIEMPLSIEDVCSKPVINMFQRQLDKEGLQRYNQNLEEVEIYQQEIENAINDKRAVYIGGYDFTNEIIIDDKERYKFGYWAIIEGMAHHIQKIVDPDVDHPLVPYKIVDLVCDKKYPTIKDNEKLLISICFISLMFENPGGGFFEVASYACNHNITDGRELYNDWLLHSISYNGHKLLNREFLALQQNELLEELRFIGNCEMKYFTKVFKTTNAGLETGESTLLNMIYDGTINDKSLFGTKFLRIYGLPFTESHKSSLLPQNPHTGKPYTDFAVLASWELLYYRISSKIIKCGRYDVCRRSDKFTIECGYDQWDKKEDCLLSMAFRYYGHNVKEWRQKRL